MKTYKVTFNFITDRDLTPAEIKLLEQKVMMQNWDLDVLYTAIGDLVTEGAA